MKIMLVSEHGGKVMTSELMHTDREHGIRWQYDHDENNLHILDGIKIEVWSRLPDGSQGWVEIDSYDVAIMVWNQLIIPEEKA